MNWEQKLAALKSLTETHLEMRAPGEWYVAAYGRSIGGDGFLTSTYGNGKTPQEAVERDWEAMTSLPYHKYIVVYKSDGGSFVRWNGFMWERVIVAGVKQ